MTTPNQNPDQGNDKSGKRQNKPGQRQEQGSGKGSQKGQDSERKRQAATFNELDDDGEQDISYNPGAQLDSYRRDSERY